MFSALVVLGGGAFLLLRGADTGARTARISLDGEVYEEIDLNAVAMPYDIRIETELGYNIVHVEHGAISVSEADCPDQVCVHQGRISLCDPGMGAGLPELIARISRLEAGAPKRKTCHSS